jgi:16S rRNA C967 or C1407 C5-methylase (RsmB/RsmF family)/NOL1/NOP2/fmu family ribosome biogenesis protein
VRQNLRYPVENPIYVCIMSNLPQAFVDRIKLQFSAEADELLNALENAPNTSVHLHPLKYSGLWEQNVQVPWFTSGRFLAERPLFTLDPLFHVGCYYPQESSSMILHHVLTQLFPRRDGLQFLDLCAAPGGKSIVLSEFLRGAGRVVSNELNRSRNQILKENLIKWGTNNTIVTCNDSEVFANLSGNFDCVLVDAPCSGEGMFRKDINARDEWSEGNVQLCSMRQRDILNNVLPSIKEGGFLIYSTCTFAPDENERNCEWLVNEHQLEGVAISVDANWGIRRVLESGFDALQFLPHCVSGEGFFIAVFRKRTSQHAHGGKTKLVFSECTRKETEILSKWVDGEFNFLKGPDDSYYVSNFSTAELNNLAISLYITLPGVELGKIIRDELIPAHALAVSGLCHSAQPSIELNREEALSYLRGDVLIGQGTIGWQIAKFNGQPLGWIKAMKNRANNYYPKEWRIRMR